MNIPQSIVERCISWCRDPQIWIISASALVVIVVMLAIVPMRELQAQVLTGIDVLVDDDFAQLDGKRVGVVTNQTGVTRDLRRTTVEAFLSTKRCRVVAFFAPEHGIDGTVSAGGTVADQVEPRSGLPVRSLYGATRRPTRAMLSGIDVMVYDIQDIGVRSYTFISTLVRVMEGCADAGVPLVVLDRPNPIGGDVVDGPVLDTAFRSFVGIIPVAYIHGMTVGELAMAANAEGWLEGGRRCNLQVVRMRGWRRSMTWRETGLIWVPTSPNVPTPEAAFCNAITGAMGELQFVNIGIGTPLAFSIIAREWIDPREFADRLNGLGLAGIRFRPVALRQPCQSESAPLLNGVQIMRTGGHTQPFTAQLAIVTTLRDLYAGRNLLAGVAEERWQMFDKVCGTDRVRKGLLAGELWGKIADSWNDGLRAFIERREGWLLYE